MYRYATYNSCTHSRPLCFGVNSRRRGTRYFPQSPSIHFQVNNTNITLLRCDITRVTINGFHRLRRNNLRRIRVEEGNGGKYRMPEITFYNGNVKR